MKTNEYKNKKFSILGDSLSTLQWYTEPSDLAFYDREKKAESGVYYPLDTWWGIVVDSLGGEVLVNNSISGSMVIRSAFCEFPSYACSDERTSSLNKADENPDVIMVYIGTNDFGAGVKIDCDKTENLDETNCSIFSVAYKTMLKKLKNNYPLAEIWCFTLTKSYCSKNPDFEFPTARGGIDISNYCNAIVNCANEYGHKIIDLYNTCEPYDTIDGFHPNKQGMQTLAQAVLKCV